jgi:hypothetical protein
MDLRGTTLVEVMVAAVLLACGLAAGVATARAATWLAESGGRRAEAALIAAAVLDSVSLGCVDGRRSGPNGLEASWAWSGPGPWRSVDLVVAWPVPGRWDTLRLGGVSWCPP